MASSILDIASSIVSLASQSVGLSPSSIRDITLASGTAFSSLGVTEQSLCAQSKREWAKLRIRQSIGYHMAYTCLKGGSCGFDADRSHPCDCPSPI